MEALLGAAAGLVIGFFGAGGSILLLPILVYVLGFAVPQAVLITLAVMALTGAAAAVSHARSGHVNWKLALSCAGFGTAGALAGGRLSHTLPAGILMMIFSLVVMVSAARLLRSRRADERKPEAFPSWSRIAMIGIAIGFLTGLVGVGGGFLLVPCLHLVCDLNWRRAMGTSLVIITLQSLAGFVGAASHGSVPWAAVAMIGLPTALGSIAGGYLSERCPDAGVRRGFAALLFAVGVYTLARSLTVLAR